MKKHPLSLLLLTTLFISPCFPWIQDVIPNPSIEQAYAYFASLSPGYCDIGNIYAPLKKIGARIPTHHKNRHWPHRIHLGHFARISGKSCFYTGMNSKFGR